MNYYFKFLWSLLLIGFSVSGQNVSGVEVLSTYQLPGVSVRAMEVIDEDTLWFAGSSGRYGRINQGELVLDSISFEGNYPSFRSIAYNGSHIFLLSIESPALLYKIDPGKTLGQHDLVYREDGPNVFYDALVFFDDMHGLAMGDPTGECLSVLKTSDGGQNWTKLSCDLLPGVLKGEAAFAASNTNIATFGENAWMVTGGSSARVFISRDFGDSWEVRETPMVQGGKMTGIFTTDFHDENNGIIMGGDWENKKYNANSKAITTDGGHTWTTIASNELPGYISCVRYRPGSDKELVAVSTEGIFYSNDHGTSWNKIDDRGYYSLRFIDAQHAWMSTHEEIAKIKLK